MKFSNRTTFVVAGIALVLLLISLGAILTGPSVGPARSSTAASQAAELGNNPNLDPGTALSRPAPEFTLTDQFGRRVSLSSFRGHVVILAFIDSKCTTVCPLTTTAMADAQRMLGAAGSKVTLLGIDANPHATAISDVRAFSKAHGMIHRWQFLTGSPAKLREIWKQYGIAVEINSGLIDHTPALYVISPGGQLRRLYTTEMNYASVLQQSRVLATEASKLLPGHPAVHSSVSYSRVASTSPASRVTVPTAAGGRTQLGPAGKPRLYLFFDSWLTDAFPHFARDMTALNGYVRRARATGLPSLTAVDEASVEPSPQALHGFLKTLPTALRYPVAIDLSGRIADGYQVQDQPWMVLISAAGKVIWWRDVSRSGWLGVGALEHQVKAALTSPKPPPGATQTNASTSASGAASLALLGSPPALAALHRQASQLLGSSVALYQRLAKLHGYPVLVNAWASWCSPCQKEFPLLAAASLRYGKRVAFVGVDVNDQGNNARAFLAKHPVSYPSYQASTGQLAKLAAIQGLPETIYINSKGKVVHVHIGEYDVAGSLDADIAQYLAG